MFKFYMAIFLCFLALQGVRAQNGSLCVEASIEIREGSTTITCEPGAQTWIRFRTSKVNTPYGYIVTDQSGTMLRISISDKVSFIGLPGGQLRVYAFSYIGLVLAQEGDNLFTADLASVCSAISPNYIGVLNIVPEGGTVQSGNGRTTEYICTEDDLIDLLSFETSETNEPIYAYIITDENNLILSSSEDAVIDFTSAQAGVCRVWGIAYTGNLTAEAGADILTANLAEGCFDVSDNYVSVVRTQPDGGTIMADGATQDIAACDYPGGNGQVIELSSTNAQTFPYNYIITDEAESTYKIVAGTSIVLSELPMGRSRVRGISYAGSLGADSGNLADLTSGQTGCFEFSENFITLTRTFVEGGRVTLADGTTSVRPCGIDDLPDQFSFLTSSTAQESYAWILTGGNNVIKGVFTENLISIDEFPEGDNFRVRGLSYSGNLLPVVGQRVNNAVFSDDCFQVSNNFVTITRIRPNGGTVSLADGSTDLAGCDSPDLAGQTILDLANSGAAGFTYVYFLTNNSNTILEIIEGEAIPLSNLPKGASRIWGLSYEGTLTAQTGDNLATGTPVVGCFDLSDNFISLQRTVVDGGEVSIFNGGTSALTCGNDNISDAFTFNSTTTAKDQPYVLVVTDQNNRVFSTANGGIIDFDLFAAGTYRIWGLSYTGTLTVPFGSRLTNITPSTGCYDLSNNFVTIRQEETNGGQLQFVGGGLRKFTCPDDGKADVLNFVNNGFTSDKYIYLISDENNIIIGSTESPSYDFDVVPADVCRIWGLAYSGTLNAPIGEKADTLVFSDECYSLTSNFLTVVRETPSAGSVSLPDGSNLVFTCPGDGKSDMLNFVSTSNYEGIYIFLITHEDNRVIDVSFTGTYDFDFAEPGNCRVWGVAFTGNWIIQQGSLITEEPLSDDCWAITDNYVTVVRETPTAGVLSFADGSDTQYTCPGDGKADLLEYVNTSAYPGSYLYMITDASNKIITSTTEEVFDFDALPAGDSRVYGVAYTGDLQFLPGDDITFVNVSDDCFEVSSNFLTVVRETPEAGTVSTPGGDNLTLCVGDAFADVVQMSVDGASNSPYAYLITDENGFLIGAITDNAFDFNNAVGGICRIYGMAYTGEITVFPGDDINDVVLSSDCYDVSENFITLNRLSVDGNTIFTGSGSTDVEYICDGDGEEDVVTFQNGNNDPQVSYQYLITSTKNIIIGDLDGNTLDLEGSPFDSIRIYGVAYTGNPSLPIGSNITAAVLSDSCYDISNNFITLINDLPAGGTVSTVAGATNIRVCIGGTSGLVEMANSSASLSGYTYIVTTTDQVIVGSAAENVIDFNAVDPGNYLVYGLSYTGQLQFQVGDTITVAALASSCYELSSNGVQVERTPPLDAGTITSPFGDPLYICLNDGKPDIGAFETTSTDPNYRFVITDTLDRIIIPDIVGNVVDFDKANPGFCRVYGVSFTGNFTANVGNNIFGQLSDLCSAVSSNYISLVKANFNGGTVSTDAGEILVHVVVGDETPDVIRFTNAGASGVKYAYVITDDFDAVLSVVPADSVDFEDAAPGICRVYGLSYSGELTIQPGDTITSSILSNGCFELSENHVLVNRTNSGVPLIGGQQESAKYATPGPKLHVYPNPVSNTLQLQLSVLEQRFENASKVTIEVFDVAGRRWSREVQSLNSPENRYRLDVRELPIGMYILRISDGKNRMQERFFKQ